MYSDDTKGYNSVEAEDKQHKLQDDLYNLVDWADTWQLRFNADKCEVLHLGRQNRHHKYKMRKHGRNKSVELQSTELKKDLGVNVDTSLKCTQHVEIQVNKASSLLGLIRRSFVYLDSQP